jgi:hypothetical protein
MKRGVVDAEEVDGSPYPTAFLAITLITYAMPFVKPVIVRDVGVGYRPAGKSVQSKPLLLEY